MGAHWDARQQRISQHSVVLCLQDKTELDDNGQQMQGLGPLSHEAKRGLYLRTRPTSWHRSDTQIKISLGSLSLAVHRRSLGIAA